LSRGARTPPGAPPEGSGLKSPLFSFGFLSFAYFAGIGLFNPFSPLWLQSLGFSALAIGGIASLQSWTRLAVPYAWSWLGDHTGRRIVLLRLAAGCALGAAAVLLWVRGYTAVAVVVTLLFAFNGAIVPLSEAAVARHLGAAGGFDAGRYGRVRMWGSVGFIAAVLGGGIVLETIGVQWFPATVLGVYALLLLAAFRLPLAHEEATHETAAPSVLPQLRQRVVQWFYASIACTVLAHTSLYTFFSLYLDSLQYTKTQVGLLWAVSVALEIVFFWLQGRWFHRLTPWRWLQLASAVAALRFATMALLGQWALALVVAQASHAITFAAHHAACTALLHRHFPGRLRGRGQALYATLGYGLPGVVGGVGGGWIVERLGFPAVFGAATLAAVLGWICATRGARLAQQAEGGLRPVG
jgi:PPP family 3-phenylpropionic acid transporter